MTGLLGENVQCSNVSDTPKTKQDSLLETMPSYSPGTLSPIIVDSELEKRALRKFDIFLLPQLALVTIVAYLDRTNLGEHMIHILTELTH
jgi:hypothetical protein